MADTPFTSAPVELLDNHRRRELRTIHAMFDIYCRGHHGQRAASCTECGPVLEYATRRLVRCVFGNDKPTCANCTVHCYTPGMRARAKDIMRYAGPRMMWQHPWLALMHVRDGRRPAPLLPKPARPRAARPARTDEGKPA